jgi:hypothetical protein
MRELVKTLGVIIVVVLLGIVTVAPVAAQGEVSVNINAPAQVEPGNDFTATVVIGEVTNLNAVQYDLSFNSSVLQLDDITSGQIGSKEMPVMFNEVSTGTYRVVQSLGLSTVDGSGYLAVLHFHALQAGEGDTSMSNGVLAGMEGEISAGWTGSSVVVGSGSPPTSNPSATPSPLPPPPAPSVQQPKVVSVSPTTGAGEVPVNTTVMATFDKAMNGATINTGSFRLRRDSAVAGIVSYDTSTQTATFTPDANLEWGASYTVTLSSSITDVAGSKLTGISWSFTTEQAPAENAGHVAGLPAVGDTDTPDEVTAPPASHQGFIKWAIIGAAACMVLVFLIVVLVRLIRRRAYYGY